MNCIVLYQLCNTAVELCEIVGECWVVSPVVFHGPFLTGLQPPGKAQDNMVFLMGQGNLSNSGLNVLLMSHFANKDQWSPFGRNNLLFLQIMC